MLSSTETLLVVALVYGLLFVAGRLTNRENDTDDVVEGADR